MHVFVPRFFFSSLDLRDRVVLEVSHVRSRFGPQKKVHTSELRPRSLPDLLRRRPNERRPKKTRAPNNILYTANVKPAPRKPAPTGLMRSWWDDAATEEEEEVAAPRRAAQPRSVFCPQVLHHSSVVLIATGSMTSRKVDRGTSPGEDMPGSCML